MTLDYPDTGLVSDFELYRKVRPTITLVVNREVVSPVLFRNTHSDRAETQEFGDTLHAQVNGEKFVSKERLTGLDLLRRLSEKYGDESDEEWSVSASETPPGLISSEYTYNEPGSFGSSLNPDALTYGIAGTGTDTEFGLKSRVVEGYTYSTDVYDLLNKETRNAVYESGTMQDEGGDQSQALFEYAKIHPGNSFVHFVTLEAATPAMLLYALHNILNTTSYGARETRSGKTLDNSVEAIILGDHGTSLSTGELLMNYRTDGDIEADIATYIDDVRRAGWEVYGDLPGVEEFPDWYDDIHAVAARTADDADEVLYEELRTLVTDAFQTLVADED